MLALRRPAGLFVAFLLLVAQANAAESPQEEAKGPGAGLLAGILQSHAALRSYTADLTADFKERSFPFMRLRLDGTAYYRAPDQYAIVFRNAPSFMKGFAAGYATMMDPGSWKRHFAFEALADRTVRNRNEHVLRLTGLDPNGALHHGDIFIDAATNDITEMDWQMSDGMTFTIQQVYAQMPLSGFHVVTEQYATFHVPFAHGVATMTLRDYHCNVPIGDDVFQSASLVHGQEDASRTAARFDQLLSLRSFT